MNKSDRNRKDIFRAMDTEIYESGKRDVRSREFLFPRRIVWTQGMVRNQEHLLHATAIQSSLITGNHCVLETTEEQKASILLDFGTELHGSLRFVVGGANVSAGMKLRIRFGESVSEAMSEIGGETNATNDHARRDMIVEAGSMSINQVGESGFRFARIDLESVGKITFKTICAVLIFKDVEYKGSFSCSDELLNRIWDVGAYTVHLNMQEYIWDGIKRDRLVWIGDMHPETTTIQAVFGEDDSVEKSLELIRKDTPLPGWMNNMASYSMWYVIIVHDWFRYTGKMEFLTGQKDYLEGLQEQLSQYIDENGMDTVREGRFVDWPSVGRSNVEDAGVQSIHILAVEALKNIFAVLGDTERVKKCEDDLNKLRSVDVDYETAKQAAALTVLAGLKDAKETNEKLLKVGGAKGMSTFMGYYILSARGMAGDYQGCLDAIREYWGGMLSLGATTFWEDFDLDWMKNAGRIDELPSKDTVDVHATYGGYCYKGYRHSFCHGWAAGVTPWLSENVLGVKVLEPGCRKVKVEPHLGDLAWAEGAYPTPHGPIKVSHKKLADGNIETVIDAPAGVEIVRA